MISIDRTNATRVDGVRRSSSNASWVLSFLRGAVTPATRPNEYSSNLSFFPSPEEGQVRLLTRLKQNKNTHAERKEVSKRSTEGSTPAKQMREFWMPDRLCKTCYECEVPFSVFRRRHHCRLCGQVFCHACASTYVDGKSVLQHGIVRTCNVCYTQLTNLPYTSMNAASSSSLSLLHSSQHEPSGTVGDRSSAPLNTLRHKGCIPSSTIVIELNEVGRESGGLCFPDAFRVATAHRHHNHCDQPVLSVDKLPILVEQVLALPTSVGVIHDYCGGKYVCQAEAAEGNQSVPVSCTRTARLLKVSVDGMSVANREEWPSELWLKVTRYDGLESSLRHRLHGSEFLAPSLPVLADESVVTCPSEHAFWVRENLRYESARHLASTLRPLLRALFDCECHSCGLNESWCRTIINLATMAATSVRLNPHPGSPMDIRPFVKVKSVPGGTIGESCCVDGIVFRQNILHKKMTKAFNNPRIMMIASCIGFHRTYCKLLSFETLLEQEQKYTHIIIEKIVLLRPDLLLVEGAVSRQAQEYLQCHSITVIQHVKRSLMHRIARMTGGFILGSADQVNRFANRSPTTLGTCHQLQCVAHPLADAKESCQIDTMRSSSRLGFMVHDGALVGCKQRVASFVFLAGCHNTLGCTLVLRGGCRQSLKRIKRITKFALFVAYHLRLETACLLDRRVRLPCAHNSIGPMGQAPLSSSLNVDFQERRPKRFFGSNGSNHRSTPLEHQGLLVCSVWMSSTMQCVPAELKEIVYYSAKDVSLGQFLRNPCLDLDSRWLHSEKRQLPHATQLLYHNDGCLEITVTKLDQAFVPVPDCAHESLLKSTIHNTTTVLTWSFCKECRSVVAPLLPVSEDSLTLSLGKFLEVAFYNDLAACCSTTCRHCVQTNHILYYILADIAIRMDYTKVGLYSIAVRRRMPFDRSFHIKKLMQQYDHLGSLTSLCIQAFLNKIRDLQALITSSLRGDDRAVPVLSRALGDASRVRHTLVEMSTEMRRYSSWFDAQLLQGFLACKSPRSGLKSAVIQFPSLSRRELYIRATRWNSQLSTIAQLVTGLHGRVDAGVDNSSMTDPDQWIADYYLEASTTRIGGSSAESIFEVVYTGGDYDDRKDIECAELDETYRWEPRKCLSVLDHEAVCCTTRNDSETGLFCNSELRAETGLSCNHSKETRNSEPRAETGLSCNNSKLRVLSHKHVSDIPVSETNLTENTLIDSAVQSGSLASLSCQEQPACLSRDSNHPRDKGAASVGRHTSKLSNAFARFMGKESPTSNPWTVHLTTLEASIHAQFCDPGDTMILYERLPTNIIAYSLDTTEYKEALENHLASHCEGSLCNHMGVVDDDRVHQHWKPSDTCRGGHTYQTNILPRSREGVTFTSQEWTGSLSLLLSDRPALAVELPWQSARRLMAADLGPVRTRQVSILKQSVDSTAVIDAVSRAHAHSPPVSHLGKEARVEKPCDRSASEMWHSTVPRSIEQQLLSQVKTHVKHRFTDVDDEGNIMCKFVCQAYWAMQFAAVRQAFLGLGQEEELGYLRSLSMARPWNAQGGKSGATFLKTLDGRFVVKRIARTELQMFLEYAPAYFEYLSKSFFHDMSTLLVRVLGVYQIGSHSRLNGRRIMEHVVVMENLFHDRAVSCAFDLKGSTRSRYARVSSAVHTVNDGEAPDDGHVPTLCPKTTEAAVYQQEHAVLLDENFVEYTCGRPLPLRDQAKTHFNSAVINDTLFLSLINVIDYSILVGINEQTFELVLGIIDYMRQYDILKKMERMGKSVGMIAGQAEPTIIQPQNYRNRFRLAMERYFMLVPDKWTGFRIKSCRPKPCCLSHDTVC